MKMNIETNLLEEDMNFVDVTKKQKKYFETIVVLFADIKSLFLIVFYLNIIQSSICTKKFIKIQQFVFE